MNSFDKQEMQKQKLQPMQRWISYDRHPWKIWTVSTGGQCEIQEFKVSQWHNQTAFYKDHNNNFMKSWLKGVQEWRQGKLGG